MVSRKAASLFTLAQLHVFKQPVEFEKTGTQLPSHTALSCSYTAFGC